MDTAESYESAFKGDYSQYLPQLQKDVLNFKEFVKGVDWTEPWLIGLMIFHLVITILTLATRHHGNFQAVFFLILLMLVYVSSNLNEIAARNWMYFSRQQYFDSNGMFISIMFSSPLLLNCLVMVGHWLWTSGDLMVKMKRAELKRQLRADRRRQRKRAESTTDFHRLRAESTTDLQKED